MVKICSSAHYDESKEALYHPHFAAYPYELSVFQKHAVEAIVEGHHVLVTAHTGSGKTMPAEFAITHYVAQGKKVIYTGPIKSLMNQKFHDFTHKFPHISFGILTGDIKFNPEADVLIVTAEILLNQLHATTSPAITSDFTIDVQTELACVIMDEVHYINDKDRGHVWENTLMRLPRHVRLVMLSATLDDPAAFARWIETLYPDDHKDVYLTNTHHRVVPLTHYSFLVTPQSAYKRIKDKATQQELRNTSQQMWVVQDAAGTFQDATYARIMRCVRVMDKHDVRVSRSHVLNQTLQYLTEHDMLPALCFVLSRKQLEECAREVTTNVLEFDSKVPYVVDRECEQLLRHKLPNYAEYTRLPEYMQMVALLQKGIAIHHSGVLPVLKEIVELMYAQGYIKVLFATETFSVGVNMPTKTVVFTDVTKYDGTGVRPLHAHELSQMSGRSGRRGIDTVGHVIHLHNLYRNVSDQQFKTMMNGRPPTLTSKFKVSPNTVLQFVQTGQDLATYLDKSMLTVETSKECATLQRELSQLQREVASLETYAASLSTPQCILDEYKELCHQLEDKKRGNNKTANRRLTQLREDHRTLVRDMDTVHALQAKRAQCEDLRAKVDEIQWRTRAEVDTMLRTLTEKGFVATAEEGGSTAYQLTTKGCVASMIHEVDCLAFAEACVSHAFAPLSSAELVALLGCFVDIRVSDDYRAVPTLSPLMEQLGVTDCDFMDFARQWCEAETEEACHVVLQESAEKAGIFLGEFVKAMLKINHIVQELTKVAEYLQDVPFLATLHTIPVLTLKYVVTNQSLYVKKRNGQNKKFSWNKRKKRKNQEYAKCYFEYQKRHSRNEKLLSFSPKKKKKKWPKQKKKFVSPKTFFLKNREKERKNQERTKNRQNVTWSTKNDTLGMRNFSLSLQKKEKEIIYKSLFPVLQAKKL